MERRTFLLGAGTALLSRTAFGANDRVNVAVVGVGSRGTDHINEYVKLPAAKVAALCDVNTAQTERGSARVEKATGDKPKVYQDLRKLYDDKDVDAVSIATPNHWHALATVWGCQAGKDVYCEKPAAYNIFEGQQMVAAARKYNRIVQIGMQGRSTPHKMEAMKLLRDGAIGKIYYAKGICYKRRKSIGHTPAEDVPPGMNWDIFLGPAPMRPYTHNRHVYNWHWFWDTGNGDIGNQGVHEMDIARWGLGRTLPTAAVSTGGKYIYEDDQETPNTQLASFDYGDAELAFEVRGLPTPGEALIKLGGGNYVGDYFMGDKGFMSVDQAGYQILLGDKREPGPSKPADKEDGTGAHMQNFLDAVKSRRVEDLHADVQVGVTSVELVHLANISYRLNHSLKFDPAKDSFINDAEANAMKTRPKYREPYVFPKLA